MGTIVKTTRIIFFICVVSLFNCAFQKFRTIIEEPIAGQPIKLPVFITRLVIEDARPSADIRDMKISRFAIPGRKDEINPAISVEQKELLEKELGKYTGNTTGGLQASCTVQILEGLKRYKSSWSGEEMTVRSKLCLILSDTLHKPYLASATGEADFSFQSNIANKMNFEILYQKAMRTALFKAVESINNTLKSLN
jgi:hypothetical protein